MNILVLYDHEGGPEKFFLQNEDMKFLAGIVMVVQNGTEVVILGTFWVLFRVQWWYSKLGADDAKNSYDNSLNDFEGPSTYVIATVAKMKVNVHNVYFMFCGSGCDDSVM